MFPGPLSPALFLLCDTTLYAWERSRRKDRRHGNSVPTPYFLRKQEKGFSYSYYLAGNICSDCHFFNFSLLYSSFIYLKRREARSALYIGEGAGDS
jgi:hypothetical protein